MASQQQQQQQQASSSSAVYYYFCSRRRFFIVIIFVLTIISQCLLLPSSAFGLNNNNNNINIITPFQKIITTIPTKTKTKTTTRHISKEANDEISNRRQILTGLVAALATTSTTIPLLSTAVVPSSVANAFDNRIPSKYDDRPKQRGSKPKDLGIKTRTDLGGDEYLGLKHCGNAPNCFCSTDTIEDDPDHNIPSWKYPSNLDKDSAFEDLIKVIESYEVGQSNIDGGGYKIIENDMKKGYLYVQFESLKNGYIDDVEFAFIKQGQVEVRSSSRLGYLDYGVNSKRINYIASQLRSKEKGWDAVGVDYTKHPNYSILNEIV